MVFNIIMFSVLILFNVTYFIFKIARVDISIINDYYVEYDIEKMSIFGGKVDNESRQQWKDYKKIIDRLTVYPYLILICFNIMNIIISSLVSEFLLEYTGNGSVNISYILILLSIYYIIIYVFERKRTKSLNIKNRTIMVTDPRIQIGYCIIFSLTILIAYYNLISSLK